MLADNKTYQLNEGMKGVIDKNDITITSIATNEFGKPVGYVAAYQAWTCRR